MRYLDLSFADPAENLACDEALLQWREAKGGCGILRLWESPIYFVVAGHANRIGTEVDESNCVADAVPVLRRSSGGGTVLQGPGCLNYALILDHKKIPGAGDITQTYRFVLERHRRLFEELSGEAVVMTGMSDLAIGGRKFSGNSQYRKRSWSLVHGTFLLGFEVARMQRYLRMPSQEPAYRQRRQHEDFLRNVGISPERVKQGLRNVWQAVAGLEDAPVQLVAELASERYRQRKWNFKF
jgi:lipoate-protein ligase A